MDNDIKAKFDELKALAKPLQEWLAKNYNPHCKIEIDTMHVEVFSGGMAIPLEYPYKD
jgi:hypothetical protein